ncbi:DNA repair ATPase [Streptomyces sp. TR06-5]|uniref:DNA repair ATPase n=1 Tax=Streptomyces sp. TR06-5 TaxID=3385976 RepID=UPI0039A36424
MSSGTATADAGTASVDEGTYEVLRRRLESAGQELARRAELLNERRTETFGARRFALVATHRLAPGRARTVRDLVQVGGLLLVGGDPAPGTGEVAVEDVLTLHRGPEDGFEQSASEAVPGLLDDPCFRQDFAELYRYYRDARLLRLRRTDSELLAVFRTGDGAGDRRVLRWRMPADGGPPAYLEARGSRDDTAPAAGDLVWREIGRDAHVAGRHPHVRVDDALFVSTEGGSLTLGTQNDTETRDGIWSEPVDEPLQSLADAEIARARVGPLVLLRILPYNEPRHRYLVHNRRTGEVVRLDGMARGCRPLPDEQGIVFPGGFHLANAPAGEAARTFDVPSGAWEFERVLHAPNGEDVLHVCRDQAGGGVLLLPYNRVRQEPAAPVTGLGWALFDDGALAVLRGGPDDGEGGTVRVHPVQVWDTPFAEERHDAVAPPAEAGPLARIGNAELVRCIAECLAVARMAAELAPGAEVFASIAESAARAEDRYPWLGENDPVALDEPLRLLRETAVDIVAEYGREEETRARTAAALDTAEDEVHGLLRRAGGETPADATGWVALLTGLRRARGDVEALYDLRHTDQDRVAGLEEQVAEALAAAGHRAVGHLAEPDAFSGIVDEIARIEEAAIRAPRVAALERPLEELGEHAARLRGITDVFEALEVADTTVRTALLSRFGEVTAALNRARAVADGRRRTLLETEGRAEFEAELALLGQALSQALAAADTSEACDEHLGTLLVRIEGLTTRFGGLPERAEVLEARREEAEEAFAARRQSLVDEQARRAERLAASAERGLATVARRAAALTGPEEIRAYFAADPMVSRLRETLAELRDAGETVRAAEFEGRLGAARQEAGRALRDRAELHDVPGTVRLGRHRFPVHGGRMSLTLSRHGGRLHLAVTGTDFREPVPEDALAGTEEFWDQPLVSESPSVYRAEYLAATALASRPGPVDPASGAVDPEAPADLVRRAAGTAHDCGYDAGVHDHDAARILHTVLELRRRAGLLRFTPEARAAAQLYWAHGTDDRTREVWAARARSLGRARRTFGPVPAIGELVEQLDALIAGFLPGERRPGSGAYLFEEIAAPDGPCFVTDSAARALLGDFREALGGPDSAGVKEYAEELRTLGEDLSARRHLIRAWLDAYADAHDADRSVLVEAAAVEACGTVLRRHDAEAQRPVTVDGLLGVHPRVREGRLTVRLDEFLARTEEFRTVRVPAHRAWTERREAVLASARDRLGLDRFRPRVQPGFVRNRLIDEVYLPLVGDALARQIGTAGADGGAAGQGMLLLLSPPGYGKTTLMEYVAAQLGMLFVTVDGPALGRRTTSLDPAAAPDAAARRELEKIDLALRLGDNVLLHLDDIQHTSPELLQKFIPLCDAQRRIEGADRAYDLRGKRFAVCMAGNPFTESGGRFRIPDMLANRADVWNLGDVLGGREDLFALSHVENALTAHPVLAPLADREREDLDLLVGMAEGDPGATADRLVHPYGPEERQRVVAVLRNLLRVRDTVLRVNAAYIASAGEAQEFRTEPPFLLQGSYRDTNRLAGRLSGVMNDEELEQLLDDHYAAEAQALASGAEAALLKLAELRGRLGPAQRTRWAELKREFG